MQGSDDDYQRHVAILLGDMGNTAKIALVQSLRDPDPSVRAGAAIALGTTGNPDLAEALLTVIGDTSSAVRGAAAEALGRLDVDKAVRPLTRLLRDRDDQVRARAASALDALNWTARGIADRLAPIYADSGAAYPLFFAWESGVWETIWNNLDDIGKEGFTRLITSWRFRSASLRWAMIRAAFSGTPSGNERPGL